ncbi:MAG: hypothetical protein ACEPOV_13765 [Hyphomicrobiales bacterium]
MNKILIIFFALSLYNCNTQTVDKEEAENPGNEAPSMGFDIENKKEYLKIDDLRGSVVLSLFVSKEGSIKDFNISFLRLINDCDTVLSYTGIKRTPLNINDYPNQVRYYYPFIKEYVDDIVLTPIVEERRKTNLFYLKVSIGRKQN